MHVKSYVNPTCKRGLYPKLFPGYVNDVTFPGESYVVVYPQTHKIRKKKLNKKTSRM